MHSTEKTAITLLIPLLLAACASQDSLIPATDVKMIDIYRGAMNDRAAQTAEPVQPQSICARLKLDESALSCRDKVKDLVAEEYQRLDEIPPPQDLDYIPYTRTVENELELLFPRLANPDLTIYIYPHLATRTRAPIPGYTTVIPLYERVEYRLPGEAQRQTPMAEAVEALRPAPVSSRPAASPESRLEGLRYAKPGNLP